MSSILKERLIRRTLVLFILSVFLISFVSADILLLQQPDELYNFGGAISIPVIVKTTTELSGNLQMDLICNGEEVNFYKNGVSLSAGEEQEIDAALVLSKEIIGNLEGFCLIKIFIKNNFILTEEFRISKLINVELKTFETEFDPEETIYIDGEAFKETGEDVDGFIEITATSDNATSNKTYQGTVKNGFFTVDFAFPKEAKAGKYFLKIRIFEKDELGEITNEGHADHSINLRQIPTSLEIIFENSEVEPGTNLRVQTILHDQTGERIESIAILTVKDEDNKILEQTEIATGEFLEFPIAYNDPPNEWSVVGASNQLTAQAPFKIQEKEKATTEIMNKTLLVTNTGNVPYNKTILIKIGENSLDVDIFLKVDEIAKFLLSAPDGEYEIEIIDDGESSISEGVFLTGKAISIKEISKFGFRNYPLAWVFVIIILALVAFLLYKRGYKKNFFGYLTRKREGKEIPTRKNSLLKTTNRAVISISLKGDKQKAAVVCLKIKDLKEIEKEKGNIESTTQKIIDLAEESKGAVYENSEYLFFIFAPLLTKTFKNEKTILNFAQKVKEILIKHNKMFKHKTDFGISLNELEIIAKKDEEGFKFMSFGESMAISKKIATKAHNDIFMSESIKGKLHSVKTEKHHKDGMNFYEIKEIKSHKDREEHQKFIGSFLKRLEEGDKK